VETIEEKKQREQLDMDTIQALNDAGSNLSKSHYVEYYFVLDSEEVIVQIADLLHEQEYDIDEPEEYVDDDGNPYYLLIAAKWLTIKPEVIFNETLKMTEIAIEFAGSAEHYDGWGTQMVR
jgi:regulator of RNase E activity RraB